MKAQIKEEEEEEENQQQQKKKILDMVVTCSNSFKSIAMMTILMGVLMAMVMLCMPVDGATSRPDPNTVKYVMQKTVSNRERARCLARNSCYLKTLTCPSQCAKRINPIAGKPSCFIDCSTKCQTTCKSNQLSINFSVN